jgi:hypothetical protein
MTTVDDIRRWIEEGKEDGQRWLIVVCDTFSHEDYPVYAKDDEEFYKEFDAHSGINMQMVMESYDLEGDIEAQLGEIRSHARPVRK